MTSTTGLRERKKAATREALHRAAVSLAAAQGVERLTVEAIADAATVSRRTFSNYFASKEQALLYADRTRLEQLVELVRARPADEPPWAALSEAAQEWVADISAGDPQAMARYRELRRHPALLAEQVATYAAAERELAAAIAGRIPGGPAAATAGRMPSAPALRARLLAANFLIAVRVANEVWLEHAPSALAELVREALALTGESFR